MTRGAIAGAVMWTLLSPPPGVAPYLATATWIKSELYNAPKQHARVVAEIGPPVDLMLHHGGAYSVRERARLEGRITDGAVLVLLDSHKDLIDQVGLVSRPVTLEEADRIEYDVASHIVPSLVDGLVDEIVHLGNSRLDGQGRLPGHLPGIRQAWVVSLRDQVGVEIAILLDGERPTPQDVYARAELRLKRHGRSIDGLELMRVRSTAVTIRTTFLDELPDFTVDPRPVILDIDEDFFALGPRGAATDPQRHQIEHDVREVIERLSQRGLRPSVISVALSPGYTPEEHMSHATAALLANIEHAGFARFRRTADGGLAVDFRERAGDTLPEVRAARAAVAASQQDPARVPEALAATQAVIERYRDVAVTQQRRGWAKSAFVRGGNPTWPWQPSPVVIAQRELNGVGEAVALRAGLLQRLGRHSEASDDLLALEASYADAYRPVSIREFSHEYGWIVGHGWRSR